MKTKFAIIGGGVAGLCAAIRLAELGEEPLVIEGGAYPSHKVCGEFLSPECVHYLEDWNIHPVAISQLILSTTSKHLILPFSSAAGGLSHLQLDPALVQHAIKCGVKIMIKTQVSSFQPKEHSKDWHVMQLSNATCPPQDKKVHIRLEALNVLIAAGRFGDHFSSTSSLKYVGFKTHFAGLSIDKNSLHMFSMPGAYLGISPIEEGKFNVACLARLGNAHQSDPRTMIRSIIHQNPSLHALLSKATNLFEDWMTAKIPDFGIKKTPAWQDVYFIGDAAITIPPASGSGLSMAICGGRLAAEYSVRQQSCEFKTFWNRHCASQLFWAKVLHKILLNPSYGSPLISLARHFPIIAKKLFKLTRQP